MATNFRVKWAKSADSFSFVAFPFQNSLKYRHFEFICHDLVTLHVTLVNIVPVIPKFKNDKCVQPLVSLFRINLSDNLSQDPTEQTDLHQVFIVW